MTTLYEEPAPNSGPANPPPEMGGPNAEARRRIQEADISLFDILANEAGRTRVKGAGRDLIARRNNLLNQYDPYQRAAVGNKYYRGGVWDNPEEGYYPQASSTNFIDMIARGDNAFLQGLADDYGSGGGSGTGTSGGGGDTQGGPTGIVGGGGGSTFDPNAFQSQMQQLIQTMFNNQQSQFNNTLASMQGSAPTLSVGSVGNAGATAADRAAARRGGIVGTLASRGRRGSGRSQARRYF